MTNIDQINFEKPTKQSPVAIILLIWNYFINTIRQLWPALIAVFLGRRSMSTTNLILISLVTLALIALVFAIIYYLRFNFKVIDDELIINKGVIRKTKLSIPLERIQTLNFEQGIIHQIFNVVKIEVDTAGSAKNEFTFNALEKSKAEYLRKLVLDRKSALKQSGYKDEIEDHLEEEKGELIFSLNLDDLIRIGLTQNHLRTLSFLFFISFWGIGELENAGFNTDFLNEENARMILQSGTVLIILFVLALFAIIIIGTVIRTVLNFYDFSMFRMKEGFKIKAGLINKKEYAALDHKIQQIKWTNNPLKRILKINRLFLKQASSIEISAKKSIKVPGIKLPQLASINTYILGEHYLPDETKKHKIHESYFWRNSLYFGIIPWPIITSISWFFYPEPKLLFLLLFIPIMIMGIYVAFKKWRYAITDQILYTHHGIFENKNNIIEIYKIQSVRIMQSPFQRRRKLATLKVYSASGSLIIPYIPFQKAKQLKNYFLFKIESSQKKWF